MTNPVASVTSYLPGSTAGSRAAITTTLRRTFSKSCSLVSGAAAAATGSSRQGDTSASSSRRDTATARPDAISPQASASIRLMTAPSVGPGSAGGWRYSARISCSTSRVEGSSPQRSIARRCIAIPSSRLPVMTSARASVSATSTSVPPVT